MTKIAGSPPSSPQGSRPEDAKHPEESRSGVTIKGGSVRFTPEPQVKPESTTLEQRSPAVRDAQATAGLSRESSRESEASSLSGASDVLPSLSPALDKARELESKLLHTMGLLSRSKRDNPELCGKVTQLMLAYGEQLRQAGMPAEACQWVMNLREKAFDLLDAMPSRHKGILRSSENNNVHFLQNITTSLGRLAIKQLPAENWNAVSKQLNSRRASDQVNAYMQLGQAIGADKNLIPSPKERQALQNMCESLAMAKMLAPHETFSNVSPDETSEALVRDMTEGEHKQELQEMQASWDAEKKLVAPEQSRKDFPRQRMKLRQGKSLVLDTIKLRKKTMNSSQQHSTVASKVESHVTNFLAGLEPQQQMRVMSHLNQTEFNNMIFTFQSAQNTSVAEWGIFDLGDGEKVIDVDRQGDTVTITYSMTSTPKLSTQVAGGATIEYDEASALNMKRTVVINPEPEPQYGPLQVELRLNQGSLS